MGRQTDRNKYDQQWHSDHSGHEEKQNHITRDWDENYKKFTLTGYIDVRRDQFSSDITHGLPDSHRRVLSSITGQSACELWCRTRRWDGIFFSNCHYTSALYSRTSIQHRHYAVYLRPDSVAVEKFKTGRLCAYNVTSKRFPGTIVVVEKHLVFHKLCVCL